MPTMRSSTHSPSVDWLETIKQTRSSYFNGSGRQFEELLSTQALGCDFVAPRMNQASGFESLLRH
jgi:hypothetical protein